MVDLGQDAGHEHEWVLLGVEFEDHASVNRYACGGCGRVWFE